jgi:hypothetical protein
LWARIKTFTAHSAGQAERKAGTMTAARVITARCSGFSFPTHIAAAPFGFLIHDCSRSITQVKT